MPKFTMHLTKCVTCKYLEDGFWCPVFCFRVSEEELNADARCRQWQKKEEQSPTEPSLALP